MNKTLYIILALLCISFSAGAQSQLPFGRERRGGSGNRGNQGIERLTDPNSNMHLPSMEYRNYSDDKFDELDKTMKERSWNSEDTAWERAQIEDTHDSYQRYIAMYPNGAHRPQATKRLIDIDVNNIFNNAHNKIPGIKQIEEDSSSLTSTLTVINSTGYPLTVMCSGPDSKSIVINTGGTGTVTVVNGDYRIGASVPPPFIRPFAGTAGFSGGRYEVEFFVVTNSF